MRDENFLLIQKIPYQQLQCISSRKNGEGLWATNEKTIWNETNGVVQNLANSNQAIRWNFANESWLETSTEIPHKYTLKAKETTKKEESRDQYYAIQKSVEPIQNAKQYQKKKEEKRRRSKSWVQPVGRIRQQKKKRKVNDKSHATLENPQGGQLHTSNAQAERQQTDSKHKGLRLYRGETTKPKKNGAMGI